MDEEIVPSVAEVPDTELLPPVTGLDTENIATIVVTSIANVGRELTFSDPLTYPEPTEKE